MSINSEKELDGLKKIGKIVSLAREEMLKNIKPGITTLELDLIGKRILDLHKATSAPKKDYDFPGYTCISINNEIAHGIPSNRVVKEGDIINVDVSAELDGFYADTGASIVVGENSSEIKLNLCKCAEEALYKAISKAVEGAKLNEIGKEIENEVKKAGFKVVRNLSGHGIGKKLHEEPDYILNYYDKKHNQILNDGLVLAIETFVTNGAEYVKENKNKWTLETVDNTIGAQFEHTIVVTKNKAIILTA